MDHSPPLFNSFSFKFPGVATVGTGVAVGEEDLKPSNGDLPVPTPTTIPAGHCKEGFTEFQGYCYKMMGYADKEEKKDWYRALETCKHELNAELASIHSAREAAKITTAMATIAAVASAAEGSGEGNQ